ncbi:MAG: hypothetical protein J6S69_07565 [Proteobacteria bacterium]|jgi:hypothetical protein|nr:hypothetical protein [Pseudomonadota bacterium]
MALNEARCGRLARAMASDTMVYMKDTIKKGLEEDNFFEVLADNMDENRKAFVARLGAEAAETNILECAIVDTIIVPMGEQGKYPIF